MRSSDVVWTCTCGSRGERDKFRARCGAWDMVMSVVLESYRWVTDIDESWGASRPRWRSTEADALPMHVTRVEATPLPAHVVHSLVLSRDRFGKYDPTSIQK